MSAAYTVEPPLTETSPQRPATSVNRRYLKRTVHTLTLDYLNFSTTATFLCPRAEVAIVERFNCIT